MRKKGFHPSNTSQDRFSPSFCRTFVAIQKPGKHSLNRAHFLTSHFQQQQRESPDSSCRVALAPSAPAHFHRSTHAICAPAHPTAKLDSPPSKTSTLHVQRQRQRSNTENLRERSISVRISQARGEEEQSHNGRSSPVDMLLGKGYSWKSTGARLPSSRHVVHVMRNPRVLLSCALLLALVALWWCLGTTADQMQRYVYTSTGWKSARPKVLVPRYWLTLKCRFYCFGPSKPPMRMSPNEVEDWNAHMRTPVIYNHHTPVEINGTQIQHVNLNGIGSTTDAIRNKERVLILSPLRDASKHLATHFDLLTQLTYPHELIDLAFLVGDCTDDTLAILAMELERVQSNPDAAFHSTMIIEKDFGIRVKQDVKDRHKFEAQGPRRKAMGRARNYLLSSALKPEHSWVYWRDVDLVDSPNSIIEDFVAHDRDVLVPNVWFHRYEEQGGKMVDIEGRCKFFISNSFLPFPLITPSRLQLMARIPRRPCPRRNAA